MLTCWKTGNRTDTVQALDTDIVKASVVHRHLLRKLFEHLLQQQFEHFSTPPTHQRPVTTIHTQLVTNLLNATFRSNAQ